MRVPVPRTVAALSLLVPLALAAPMPAAAQDVRIEIEIRDVVRDVRRLVRELSRGEVAREITAVAHEVAHEVAHAVGQATRAVVASAAQRRDWNAEQTARETRTVAIGASGTLELRNVSGDITVSAGPGGEARIEIIRVARARTDADARLGLDRVQAEVTERGTRVTVQARYPNERQQAYSVSVSYRVTVPAGTAVTAGSMSGDVTITGVRGAISADVVSGDITIRDASRVVSARTVAGDVHLENVDGDTAIEGGSMNGDVTLERVRAGRIAINTITGDITAIDVSCPGAALTTISGTVAYGGPFERNGRYQFQSHSGSVELTVGAGTGFELEAGTFVGQIRADSGVNLRVSTQSRRVLRGVVGDGGATVVATTFSGNVIIRRR